MKTWYIHVAGVCIICSDPESVKKWLEFSIEKGLAPTVTTTDECLKVA